MYKIFHNIDGEKITVLKSDTELIDFVRKIVIENEDFDFSIIGISDAKEYIEEYCEGLTLVNVGEVTNFLETYGTEVENDEDSDYVELMMDNHKCVQWDDKQFYIPEDITFSEQEEQIYNMLVDACHV
jgi:hypothetical protein